MVLFRKLLERLDNKALDLMFSNINSKTMDTISRTGDFDFHSVSIRRILNVTGLRLLKRWWVMSIEGYHNKQGINSYF